MLSVIVPVYNTSKYLKQCLECLLLQSYKNIEIVLVDDGSTDNSGSICDSYASKYDNIVVIHKKNGGLISAWVEGTRKCSGEYVGYVDSDDWVAENYFEKLMIPIDKYQCDISCCGFTIMSKETVQVDPAICNSGLYSGDKLDKLKHSYYKDYNIQNSRCTKVFKKHLILNYVDELDYSITLCEDQTITIRAILSASSVYISKAYGYYYRVNESSMSHKFNQKLIKNFDRVYASVLSAFNNLGYMNEYVSVNCLKDVISVIGLIIFSDDTFYEKKASLNKLRDSSCVKELLLNRYCKCLKNKWKIIFFLFKYHRFGLLCILARCIK